MFHWSSVWEPCGNVPQPSGLVITSGQDGLAIRTERRRPSSIWMFDGLTYGLLGCSVPDPDAAVDAPGQDALPVAAERHGKNVSIVL